MKRLVLTFLLLIPLVAPGQQVIRRPITPSGSADPGNVIFMDGVDIEQTSGSAAWWSAFSGSAPSVTSGITDAHDRAWQTNSGGRPILTLPTATSTPSSGMRFRVTSDVSVGLLRFFNGSDIHIDVNYVAGGNFQVLKNATQLAISTGNHIALNTWYPLEVSAVIHDTTGSFTCKLYDDSGTLLETLTDSDVDTRDGASTTAASTLFGAINQYEDLWIDSTGTLYGPWRIEVLAPNGAGNYAQLTRGGTDSGANFSQVNEAPAQIGGAGDDYVDSTGSNQRDSYVLANRSITGTPRSVGVHAVSQRISGSPTLKLFLRIGGVDYDGATTFTATATSAFFSQYWSNNPATGNAWTDSDIDGMEAGILWIDTQGRTRGYLVQVLVKL